MKAKMMTRIVRPKIGKNFWRWAKAQLMASRIKNGTSRNVENLHNNAMPSPITASQKFFRDWCWKYATKKYVASNTPNSATISVVTRRAWAMTVGENEKRNIATKAAVWL